MLPPRDCAPVWCGQVISIEPNLVVHAIGSQPVTDSSPMAPGLWGLDRIDQVREPRGSVCCCRPAVRCRELVHHPP
jgi:hypothetical protein